MHKRSLKNYRAPIIVLAMISILPAFPIAAALAASPLELRKAIEEKAKALQEVTGQIKETQKQLFVTETRGKTLQQELKKLDYSINQVNLGIRSSELAIDKLELEITALQYDISEAESKTIFKKSAIRELLKALEERDQESSLLALFKNRTMASSFMEFQNITTLNGSLSEEVEELGELRVDLEEKLISRASKKSDVENEHRILKNRRNLAEEQKQERKNLLGQTKAQEKVFQQQLTELERKQAVISDEIESIEEELRKKIDTSILPLPRPGVLLTPTKGYVSQNFGNTPFAQNGGYRGKSHNGVDIAAPIGTPVYAAEDGQIIETGDQDRYCRKGAYGKFIVIGHNNNLTTLYAHLSGFTATTKAGQEVKRGELIGYVGKTGYATGPHLHFTVYSSLTFYMGTSRSCGSMPYGGYLNPADYLQI